MNEAASGVYPLKDICIYLLYISILHENFSDVCIYFAIEKFRNSSCSHAVMYLAYSNRIAYQTQSSQERGTPGPGAEARAGRAVSELKAPDRASSAVLAWSEG